jgi:hypothetical protein
MGATSDTETATRRARLKAVQRDLGPAAARARRAADREHNPPQPAFFVPGVKPGDGREEEAYERLRLAVRTDTELEPRARRIFSVGCRFAGHDCVIEVGAPDPVDGDAVLAIFDVGGSEPYSVCTAGGATLRLGKRVYAVTEFA